MQGTNFWPNKIKLRNLTVAWNANTRNEDQITIRLPLAAGRACCSWQHCLPAACLLVYEREPWECSVLAWAWRVDGTAGNRARIARRRFTPHRWPMCSYWSTAERSKETEQMRN
jgi:hypothetical protein